MSAPGPRPSSGLFASLRRLLDTALELAQGRLELLQIDLEREKLRLFDGLLQAGIALLLLGIGLALIALLLVLVAPPAWRPLVLAVLVLGFLGGGVALALRARRTLGSAEGAFAATRAELARDRRGLVPPSPEA